MPPPVVLVNVFTLDNADEQTFLQAWQDDADFMKRQSGFISTQLHRAIGESPTYLNYAVWESTADFRAAFTHPEFMADLALSVLRRRLAASVPESRRAGHLRRIARARLRLAEREFSGSHDPPEIPRAETLVST